MRSVFQDSRKFMENPLAYKLAKNDAQWNFLYMQEYKSVCVCVILRVCEPHLHETSKLHKSVRTADSLNIYEHARLKLH